MCGLRRGAALALILALPLSAWGHGFGLRRPSAVTYYYPVPVVYVPAVAVAPAAVAIAPAPAGLPELVCPPLQTPTPPAPAPVPVPQTYSPPLTRPEAPTYAPPSAAPPSTTPPALSPAPSTPAPPLAEPQPLPPSPSAGRNSPTSESRSYYDVYQVAPRDPAKSAGDRCTVGFWNLTDRNLHLTVDGQPRTLPAGKSMPLDVGRKFIWKVEGRDPQLAQVGAGESALEIVIRR